MAKFKPGDLVNAPWMPYVVTVLATGTCPEVGRCTDEIFWYIDPCTCLRDWMHASLFERTSMFEKSQVTTR